MGEDDGQSAKKAAAYDYEGDPRWSEYWGNILIPPHMSSRSDVVLHYKRKFYHRFIDPDFVVEPISFNSSSQTSRPSSTTSSSSSSRSTGGKSAQAGTNVRSVRWDRQTIQFSVNAWVCIVAVLATIPLVPRNLSHRAYRLSFLETKSMESSSYSNLASVSDCNQGLYWPCYLWFCRSVEVIAKFLRRHCTNSSIYSTIKYRKYLEEPCVWVESNLATLNIVRSNAEVGLGFFLILSLFSWQRNVIQTIMYWQLLKLTYFAPVTAGDHQSVWAKIGRSVNPLIHRYASFLNTPLAAVQKWWLR